MMEEGWQFSPDANSFIGLTVRRFFPTFGRADAKVRNNQHFLLILSKIINRI
jgi:hypothetical protein